MLQLVAAAAKKFTFRANFSKVLNLQFNYFAWFAWMSTSIRLKQHVNDVLYTYWTDLSYQKVVCNAPFINTLQVIKQCTYIFIYIVIFCLLLLSWWNKIYFIKYICILIHYLALELYNYQISMIFATFEEVWKMTPNFSNFGLTLLTFFISLKS